MTDWRAITPVDVLFVRGNRLFGEAGSFAEALMPPWPSLFAGAIRSRVLADHAVDFAGFLKGQIGDGLRDVLGRGVPTGRTLPGGGDEYTVRAGSFRIAAVMLVGPRPEGLREQARRLEKDHGCPRLAADELYVPAPADIIVTDSGDRATRAVRTLEPVSAADLEPVTSSCSTKALPLLASPELAKPTEGLWLSGVGLAAHLRGEGVSPAELVDSRHLWQRDLRVGIGMDVGSRTTEEGKLFSSQAIALQPNVSFVVGVGGADGVVPATGLVRLGGDGRGAELALWHAPATGLPWSDTPREGRFRMILASPGIFENGWVPPGVDDTTFEATFEVDGKRLKARLVCAAFARHQVVSGWDLARHEPKPAQRVVPAGAVYWFDEANGDHEVLGLLRDQGLWPLMQGRWAGDGSDDETLLWRERRAEGFNNVWFGRWAAQR